MEATVMPACQVVQTDCSLNLVTLQRVVLWQGVWCTFTALWRPHCNTNLRELNFFKIFFMDLKGGFLPHLKEINPILFSSAVYLLNTCFIQSRYTSSLPKYVYMYVVFVDKRTRVLNCSWVIVATSNLYTCTVELVKCMQFYRSHSYSVGLNSQRVVFN